MVFPIEVDFPAGPLYRLGKASSPLELPSPDVLKSPAFHRFDDPQRRARVLYAGESRAACFLESIAGFRRNVATLNSLRLMPGDDPLPHSGCVTLLWLLGRRLASFNLTPHVPSQRFLDLREPRTREHLRHELAQTLVDMKIGELDASDVLGRERPFTQAIAGWALDHSYGGIAYSSRWDPRLTNWALFEPINTVPIEIKEVSPTDPDLASAMDALGLHLA